MQTINHSTAWTVGKFIHQLRYFVFIIALIGSILFLPAGGKPNSSAEVAFAASDPVIAAAGDIACDPANAHFNGGNGDADNCRQKSTSDLLVNTDVVAVLPLGDVQYYCGGYAAFQQSYDSSWGRVKDMTHPVVGNHEYINSTTSDTTGWTDCGDSNKDAAGYFNYFGTAAGNQGQGYYSYDIGAWHLIALNSNCGDVGGCGPGSPQYLALQKDLADHATSFCTLAYWHIPLFSSGGRAAANTQAFWQLLYNNNVDVILNGHDHIYERFAPQAPNGSLDIMRGMREFIVGTGGADHTKIPNGIAANSEVQNIDTYGVLKLTLHPTSYDWQFVPEAGKTFTDSGIGACHGDTPDTTPPSAPENLTASIVSGNEVNLNWTAATDNIAVVGYQVLRDGVQIANLSGNSYSYVDRSTQANTTYNYSVLAVDGVGLTSNPSTIAVTPFGLFNDDFESNSLSRWTTVTNLAAQQQEVFGGSYAARGTSNSLPTYAYKQLSVAQNDLYYRINFKIINQVQTMNLLKVRTPARLSIFAIFVANDGRLGSRNDIAGVSTFSSTNVTKGSWHELQVHVLINGSASQAEVWLDGNRISILSKPEPFGANQVGYLQLGEKDAGINFDVAYDNVSVDTQFIASNSIPTITPTFTITSTPTNTLTSTTTNTSTPTFTPTFTPSATNTSTPTTTATQTPTFTPTATLTSTFTPTPQNSIVFNDGFETGNFSQWTNNQGLVVQNQQVASGNYAARGVGIAGGGATYARKQLSTSQSDVYYRIRFKVITQASTFNLMKFRTAANVSLLSVSINSFGQLSYRNDIAGTSWNSAVSVSPGNWQSLQVHVRIADTSSQTEVWYNDVLVPALSRTESLGTNPIGFLQLGENTAGLTYDIAFDDVVASLSFIGSTIPTPTYTPTNTSTSTPTATNTPTNTPTATQTPTSTNTSTPTVSSPTVLTFIPVADTYVQSDTPTTNYGSSTQFVTDNSPVRNMLLRFTVSGVGTQTILSAKLRLYCVDPSPFGGEFHRVTDTSWSESTVNWNTAPSADSNILASLGRVSMNTWYEVDVTSLVNGDGSYSLKVSSTNADGAYYSPKEGATGFAPQLVITISR